MIADNNNPTARFRPTPFHYGTFSISLGFLLYMQIDQIVYVRVDRIDRIDRVSIVRRVAVGLLLLLLLWLLTM